MSYLHPDGSPDTLEDLLESARCFCVVAGRFLKPNEGMVVVLPFQEKFPEDRYGKYLVWRDASVNQIKINKITEEEMLYTADDGQLVWVH